MAQFSNVDLDNYSEDENTPLNQDVYGTRTLQETKEWDVFRDPPIKEESGSMANHDFLNFSIKLLKFLAYILTFGIVLISGVVSKGTLFFMTSQLKSDKELLYCNKEYDGINKQLIVQLANVDRVAWLWCIIFAFWIPEILVFLQSIWTCIFKSWTKPEGMHFFIVFVTESLHTIGLAILVFSVLPDLDVVKGVMITNCVCLIPAILNFLSRKGQENGYVKMAIDSVAIAAQITGFVAWPLVENKPELWMIPVAIFLISFGWWENFVPRKSPIPLIKTLGRIKRQNEKRNENDIVEARCVLYAIVSVWKMICFFVSMLAIIWLRENKITHIFTEFVDSFQSHNITITEIKPIYGGSSLPDISDLLRTGGDLYIESDELTSVYVLLINVFASFCFYFFGKFACKIMIQVFSYAFPVNLTVPVTVTLLIVFCGLRNGDPCYFHGVFPSYLFFNSPKIYDLSSFVTKEHAWIWLLWLLSQTWITIHIWTPKCKRMEKRANLFVLPFYNAFLVDQSMALNRRMDDKPLPKSDEDDDADDPECRANDNESISNLTSSTETKTDVRLEDTITRIYICATMWHETPEEMMEFLKSIIRMDDDQCARRLAKEYFKYTNDYYELETHIFFDDAFEMSDESEDDKQVNKFVKDLVSCIDKAASDVHQTHLSIRPPKKYPSPYGGRLEWILPGKTKMIAHLKDKSKIRHKKRWSQIMYMYYLLGHRLMEEPISVNRKEALAEHTYILALDGDIDFQPHSVQLLVDLMKHNKNLGAACGRIHPVGAGPMVWYQMFEYAIGHWLQKATEHVIGCVLCSPGCFSLFRGKALMDDNVMRKYATKSKEARDYVQYDQGEDRWLCTLILQRGYRVEYSAASDAYTHCPEGFNEFYNQRRRWVPSTLANIMDLLEDSKRTVKNNDNISMPYIAYQSLLMAGTILGPGTIFLMLVGAFVAAFQIDNWTSFYYNIIPILIFMLVCFTCKSQIQLIAAAAISAVYGLIMMAVLVGIMLQIKNDGILAPSSLFLFVVAGEIIVTAFLHPQELYCLPCGVIYYVTVPSMYLLLIIYSVFNLNNVSWGTREVQTKKTKEQLERERKEAEEAKKKAKENSFFNFLGNDKNKEGSIEFSLAGLFKCICCTHKKDGDEKYQLLHIADSVDGVGKRLEMIERQLSPNSTGPRRRSTLVTTRGDHLLDKVNEDSSEEFIDEISVSETIISTPKEERDDLVNPYWIEDQTFRKGEVDYLSSKETQFWADLIDTYLYPLDANKKEEEAMAKQLKDLRDQCVFAFFMLNALFVLVIFLLQLKKEYLHIKWPFDIKENITYYQDLDEVHITKEYLQLEPVGLVFLLFFALILLVQFTAMLLHRFGTLSHILASTELNFFCTKKPEDLSPEADLNKSALDLVRFYQRLKFDEDENKRKKKDSILVDKVERRKTVLKLDRARHQKIQMNSLEAAFKRRFLDKNQDKNVPILANMRRDTLRAFHNSRNTILHQKSPNNTDGDGNFQDGQQINDNNNIEDFNRGHYANDGFVDDEDIRDGNSLQLRPRNNRNIIINSDENNL